MTALRDTDRLQIPFAFERLGALMAGLAACLGWLIGTGVRLMPLGEARAALIELQRAESLARSWLCLRAVELAEAPGVSPAPLAARPGPARPASDAPHPRGFRLTERLPRPSLEGPDWASFGAAREAASHVDASGLIARYRALDAALQSPDRLARRLALRLARKAAWLALPLEARAGVPRPPGRLMPLRLMRAGPFRLDPTDITGSLTSELHTAAIGAMDRMLSPPHLR